MKNILKYRGKGIPSELQRSYKFGTIDLVVHINISY